MGHVTCPIRAKINMGVLVSWSLEKHHYFFSLHTFFPTHKNFPLLPRNKEEKKEEYEKEKEKKGNQIKIIIAILN